MLITVCFKIWQFMQVSISMILWAITIFSLLALCFDSLKLVLFKYMSYEPVLPLVLLQLTPVKIRFDTSNALEKCFPFYYPPVYHPSIILENSYFPNICEGFFLCPLNYFWLSFAVLFQPSIISQLKVSLKEKHVFLTSQ